ncbi:MAG: TonB-dependent receptor [Firmicutes bacterium]|nr:TonB-dependent receptor [Bacillota bacterium]
MNNLFRLIAIIIFTVIITTTGITTSFAQETKTQEEKIPTEEINITANKVKTPQEQTGSSVTVITRKQIETEKKPLVKDYLTEVPGVFINSNGPAGQLTTVSIRGAQSEQTLVLIDGIPVNDPASPGRGFDFSSLPADNVERIEVLRGAQSTVYGSNAMGGVINIITRSGKPSNKQEVKTQLGGETGGYESNRYNLSVTGNMPNIGFSAGVAGTGSGVLSAASPKYGNSEPDPYRNTEIYGNIKYEPTERLKFNIGYRNDNQASDLDSGGGPMADAAGYWTKTKRDVFSGGISYALILKKWDLSVNYSNAVTDRTVYGNPWNPPGFDERYKGTTQNLTVQNTITAGNHKILAGYVNETEKAFFTDYDSTTFTPFISPEQSATMNSFYVQDNFDVCKKLFVSAGFRNDSHSIAGSRTTWRATANYHISESFFVKGSYGTGFKAPTLFQLYSSYGNPNLKPELSKSWDAGVEYLSKDKKHNLSFVWFNNKFDELIDYDLATSTYYNISKASTYGLEIAGKTKLHPRVTAGASYTWMKTRDDRTGLELLRRPSNKFALNCKYELPKEKGSVFAEMVSTGERKDMDFSTVPSTRVTLPGYTVFNAAASYRINKNLEAYVRGDNIFNEKYETVWGYSYPGASLSGGIRINF